MVHIKYSGNTKEFERQSEALLFLKDLRDKHDALIKSLVPPTVVGNDEDFIAYRSLLRHAAKKHPLKVEIIEYDMTGLI